MLSDVAERIDRLERQVHYLLRYMGVDPEVAAVNDDGAFRQLPVAASPEVFSLVRAGKPIQAIKVYRQMTGAGPQGSEGRDRRLAS
jgi:hypothetical protein